MMAAATTEAERREALELAATILEAGGHTADAHKLRRIADPISTESDLRPGDVFLAPELGMRCAVLEILATDFDPALVVVVGAPVSAGGPERVALIRSPGDLCRAVWRQGGGEQPDVYVPAVPRRPAAPDGSSITLPELLDEIGESLLDNVGRFTCIEADAIRRAFHDAGEVEIAAAFYGEHLDTDEHREGWGQ